MQDRMSTAFVDDMSQVHEAAIIVRQACAEYLAARRQLTAKPQPVTVQPGKLVICIEGPTILAQLKIEPQVALSINAGTPDNIADQAVVRVSLPRQRKLGVASEFGADVVRERHAGQQQDEDSRQHADQYRLRSGRPAF